MSVHNKPLRDVGIAPKNAVPGEASASNGAQLMTYSETAVVCNLELVIIVCVLRYPASFVKYVCSEVFGADKEVKPGTPS